MTKLRPMIDIIRELMLMPTKEESKELKPRPKRKKKRETLKGA